MNGSFRITNIYFWCVGVLFFVFFLHYFGLVFCFLTLGKMFIASGCVVKRDGQRETYSEASWLKYKWISRELMHGMRNWKTKQSRQAFIFIACHHSIFVPSLCFVEATPWQVAAMIAWMNPRPRSASSHIRLVSAVIHNVPPFSSSICISPAGHKAYDEWCYKLIRCWLTAHVSAMTFKCF